MATVQRAGSRSAHLGVIRDLSQRRNTSFTGAGNHEGRIRLNRRHRDRFGMLTQVGVMARVSVIDVHSRF